MSIYQLHSEGGMNYMAPLSIILVGIVGVTGYVIYGIIRNTPIHPNWLEAIKQLGMLGLALGTLGTLIAFFQAFGDLSRAGDTIPFDVIMGGLTVALYTVIYGFVIFSFSLATYLILRFVKKNS